MTNGNTTRFTSSGEVAPCLFEIGWRTVENAKREIGVVSERADPNDKRSPYHWLIRIADFEQGAEGVNV